MNGYLATPALILAAALMLCASPASAADLVEMRRMNLQEINRQYQAAGAELGPASNKSQRHARMLAMHPGSSLALLIDEANMFGRTRRYEQTYRGMPIYGKNVVINEDSSGKIRSMSGDLVTGLSSDLTDMSTRLTKAQALNIAKRDWLGIRLGKMAIRDESVRTMIYLGEHRGATVVHVVNFFAEISNVGNPTMPTVIINSNTGEVIRRWESLAHVQIGTGPGGNQKTGPYEFGTNFGYNKGNKGDGGS